MSLLLQKREQPNKCSDDKFDSLDLEFPFKYYHLRKKKKKEKKWNQDTAKRLGFPLRSSWTPRVNPDSLAPNQVQRHLTHLSASLIPGESAVGLISGSQAQHFITQKAKKGNYLQAPAAAPVNAKWIEQSKCDIQSMAQSSASAHGADAPTHTPTVHSWANLDKKNNTKQIKRTEEN